MMTRYRSFFAIVMSLGVLAVVLSSPAGADRGEAKETCASRYPNAPTAPLAGYAHKSEDDAYMAFRRAAVKAGYIAVKKAKRERAQQGPCVGHGEHMNMQGARPATNGKKPEWGYIGSMSSCTVCEDTSRGPRLHKVVWRIHPDF